MVAGSRASRVVLFSAASFFVALAPPPSQALAHASAKASSSTSSCTSSPPRTLLARAGKLTIAAGDPVLDSHWRAKYQAGTQECRGESTELSKKTAPSVVIAVTALERLVLIGFSFMVVCSQVCEGS